ncbi:mitotic spindle assembly checkpoint protein MAD2A-like [Ornithodoros turicata]|uniref:mitotic spindle assembly checkpoint protein MAD2A-like n=1 Tax=Ornithodoros turicata TaxID=34597 RepID=UPI00313967D8
MSGTATATQNAITLKGSAEIVAEFFNYGINSILYQRGVYPPDMFTRVEKYGLGVLMTTERQLQDYLDLVLSQLKAWIEAKEVHQVVLVISSVDTKETLERWEFNVQTDEKMTHESKPKHKDLKEIQSGIRDIIRQIVASVTYLPILETACAFDLLIYTSKNSGVPKQWAESSPLMIEDSETVRLKSFSTSVHTVDTAVTYKTSFDI